MGTAQASVAVRLVHVQLLALATPRVAVSPESETSVPIVLADTSESVAALETSMIQPPLVHAPLPVELLPSSFVRSEIEVLATTVPTCHVPLAARLPPTPPTTTMSPDVMPVVELRLSTMGL